MSQPKYDKRALVPRLRFPEFRDAGEWIMETLDSLASISTEKVGGKVCVPMSITSGMGLVSQQEKFGRIIAGSSYQNYLLLKPNDFAYNKSATKDYPEGFIALYSGDELAAVPNSIFTCFRVNGYSPVPQYLNYLFLGNLHGQWLRKFIQVGARAHGSLSINDSDLLALPVPLPKGQSSIAEQQKIADCLSSLDERITAETGKLASLKNYKKGLMQELFPREGETVPRLRFPEFRDAGEWEEKLLGAICDMQAGKFVAASEISELQAEGLYPCFGGNGLRGYTKMFNQSGRYSLVGRQGALCGNVNLVEGHFYATEHAVVATPKPGIGTDWLFCNLCFLNLNRFATGQAQPGLSVEVLEKVNCVVPKDEKEQQKIADCLSSLDELITAQSQNIETLKRHKNGLMQQLFPVIEEIQA